VVVAIVPVAVTSSDFYSDWECGAPSGEWAFWLLVAAGVALALVFPVRALRQRVVLTDRLYSQRATFSTRHVPSLASRRSRVPCVRTRTAASSTSSTLTVIVTTAKGLRNRGGSNIASPGCRAPALAIAR
jgi:hypothetical protein